MQVQAIQGHFYRYDAKWERKLKDLIIEHLLRLSPEDRRMRFFAPIGDDAIRSYVEKLRDEDELFFTFDVNEAGDLKVVGFLQVASLSNDEYEIGVSVDADMRGQNIATKLFDRAFLFTRGKGCKHIYINCLNENVAMQRIISKYKLEIKRDPDDPYTRVAIVDGDERPDFYAYLAGLHHDQIALFDLAFRKALKS